MIMKNELALSYSRLSDYEQCPLKFKSKYVDKNYPDDSDNPAFKKGREIHKQLENYVLWREAGNGPRPVLGVHSNSVVPLLDKLLDSSVQVITENQIAIDQNWELCDWFASPTIVKYRAVIDLIVFFTETNVALIDYKSGKYREYSDSDSSQLRLTAAMIFSVYPLVEEITNVYLYVEHKQTVKAKFYRDQLETLKKPFNEAYEVVNNDSEWAHKKNKYCNWCLVPNCPIKGG